MITVLTGANTFASALYVKQRVKEFDGDVETVDGAELEPRHLPDLFMGASLFSPRRLIVLKGAAQNKTVWTELEQWVGRVPAETEIILVEPQADKRTKTYKQLQKHASIKEHKDLTEAELVSWLQTHARSLGTDLSLDTARYMVRYVGHDQWRLSSELEKLQLAEQPVTAELIHEIAEPYPEASAFELLESVFRRDAARTEELIDVLSAREDPFQFFGLLSSQVMALLAIVAAGSRRPADIAADIGTHPYVVTKLIPVAKKRGQAEINRVVAALAHCDERIKTSGIDPWRQLRLTLLEIASSTS